jgi:uncharacterized iron-regulated membrane protein
LAPLRQVLLKIHLFLGLAAGIFLVVLGLTGSIIAFEGDLDRWLHPSRWHVVPGGRTLTEADLVAAIEQQVTPARVAAIELSPAADRAQILHLNDRSTVLVNPYDASILARLHGPTRTQRVLGYIHQIHLRLAPDGRAAWSPAGKVLVSYAGLVLCVMVPTGLVLWWRRKKLSIRSGGSWFRLCFDAHNVIGLYASVFLGIAAFTGVMIGFEFGERAIYSLTHSSRPSRTRPPQSALSEGATSIPLDQALEVARKAIPDAFVEGIMLPLAPKDAFTFILRVPEETSGNAHSDVMLDRYTGKVLQVHDFRTDSQGYRWIRFNRSVHTGDVWGLAGHVITSASSLLLVVMVITGVVIWWKKLAL